MRISMRVLLMLWLGWFCGLAWGAETVAFKEGEHYQRVRERQLPAEPGHVLVEEFFWYGCSHCYVFDPSIEAWKARKPADVDFVRVPASLGRAEGLLHSRAFYTASALNLSERMHRPLFDAIHREQLPLATPEQIWQVFNRQTGILPEVFGAAFNSRKVGQQLRASETLARAYGVTGVPTLVVGGAYYTNISMGGGAEGTLACVDALIERVRSERGAAQGSGR